jgi:predicted RNA-binding Zn ribbon-like protein
MPETPREPLPVELMNTVRADRDGAYDTLTDVGGLSTWLTAAGVTDVTAALDVQDVENFRSLRTALRVLAAEITGDTRPIATHSPTDIVTASADLNRASALAPSWSEVEWQPDGPQLRTNTHATPATAALSRTAEQAIHLFGSPDRASLRACHAPGCVLYFVRDHPRREWCSPGCGNRARVARHYARHKDE